MTKRNLLSGFTLLIVIIVVAILWKGNSVPTDLQKLSPKQIINLYFSDVGADTLKKIIYFSSGTTEEQKQKKVDALTTKQNPEAKRLLNIMGVKFKARYEKTIDENTAEVGVVSKAGVLQSLLAGNPSYIFKEVPAYQIILKKDEGIWKYHYIRSHFTVDELTKMIRKNPQDASLYYYYGFHIRSENPAKADKFFKKYYELEPNGFWVTESFISDLREYENPLIVENKMLSGLSQSPLGNRGGDYLLLGQYFMEFGEYEKTESYFEKAEDIFKKFPFPLVEKRLVEAKKELELRKSGQYHDILDEIEAKQNK